MGRFHQQLSVPPGTVYAALALAGAIAAPAIALRLGLGENGSRIATLALMYMSAVLALSAFTSNSGIVSFGHAAFMAIGAYVSGILTMPSAIQKTALPHLPVWLSGHEWGLAPALLAVVAAGIIVALISGLPIARLAGSSAAIATLALLIIIYVILAGARDITRGIQSFYGVPRLTNFWVALACACFCVVVVRLFRDTALGLKLRATRENEVAASAHGVHPFMARYCGWILSVTLAAVAGAIYGHFLGAFSPKDFYFDLTFMLIAMLVVGGSLTVTGAIAGTILITAVIQVLRLFEGGAVIGGVTLPTVFGLTELGLGLTLLLTIWRRPLGLAGLREFALNGVVKGEPLAAHVKQDTTGQVLTVGNLSKSFGGLVAVDDVSFAVTPGEVVGLIGPNGAGKTTLVNMICGQTAPDRGSVSLDGADITGLKPYRISRAGLGRTFQAIKLFDRLTVLENVTVAALASEPSLDEARRFAAALIRKMDLGKNMHQLANSLPYGHRRRLEIARALALKPRYLLLDEPAAGMNPVETSALVGALSATRTEFGLGLLVIEHDMRLIMQLCDRIVVLSKGQKIAEGTPEEVRHDPKVVEVYIGAKH